MPLKISRVQIDCECRISILSAVSAVIVCRLAFLSGLVCTLVCVSADGGVQYQAGLDLEVATHFVAEGADICTARLAPEIGFQHLQLLASVMKMVPMSVRKGHDKINLIYEGLLQQYC